MLDRKIVVSATGALVLGLASLAWFGAAQAAGYPKYSGGSKTLDVTGSGSFDADSKTYKADKEICDFVVSGVKRGPNGETESGVTITEIIVTTKTKKYGEQFRVDDNGDGNLTDGDSADTDEDDNTDGDANANEEVRTISEDDDLCIPKNHVFQVKFKGSAEHNTSKIKWQATGNDDSGDDGIGGGLLSLLAPVDEGNRTAVAEIYNPFDNLAILAFGENAGPTPITAIEIEVPAEVSIESVLSDENPGTWDAASGTFVFAQPVVPGTTLLV